MDQYSIKITTDYNEYWRFNIVVMGSVMVDGEQVELLKYREDIAPVGAELKEPPKGYKAQRDVELMSVPATNLTLYIYIIPHSLPATAIERQPIKFDNFELRVEVMHGSERVYNRIHEICSLAGENIVVKV